jgi:hypothetical protein
VNEEEGDALFLSKCLNFCRTKKNKVILWGKKKGGRFEVIEMNAHVIEFEEICGFERTEDTHVAVLV